MLTKNREDYNDYNKDIDVLILIATDEEEKAILNNDDKWEKLKKDVGYTYFKKIEGLTFAMARAIDMRETEMSVVGQYFIL